MPELSLRSSVYLIDVPNSSLAFQTEIVFIDSLVENYQYFVENVNFETALYILHPQEDGIEQITAILQRQPQFKTVHIVSHGSPGCVYLGNRQLSLETLPNYSEKLQTWSIDNLIFYGCEIAAGSTGKILINQLHNLTDATVSASLSPVGNVAKGGQWVLQTTAPGQPTPLAFSSEVLAAYPGLLAAGDLDNSFSGDGIVYTDLGRDYDVIYNLALQPDGKILATGGEGQFALVRYNSNGSLDSSFSGDGKVITNLDVYTNQSYDVALQADNKIIVAGTSDGDFAVVRYNSNGSLDTSFSGDGKVLTDWGSYDVARSVILQPDGKILVAGDGGLRDDFSLVRYNSNGTLDTSFSGDGKVTTDFVDYESGYSIALQPNGKIVMTGYIYDESSGQTSWAVARYNPNGSLDTSFSGDGKVITNLGSDFEAAYSVTVQPDGKIVVAGESNRNFALVRYNSDGSLDTSFSDDGKVFTNFDNLFGSPSYDAGYSVVLQPDGKILVSGESSGNFAIARYNSNGSLDTSFSKDGKATTDLGSGAEIGYNLALQPDGKIVIAGQSNGNFAVVRYLGDSIIKGTANNDTLAGTNSADLIQGLDGNDTLKGLGGNDTILGGKGADLLIGNAGNDTLTGGGGADRFLYKTNTAFSKSTIGRDTITDFTDAQGDKIILDKTTFTTLSSNAGTGFSVSREFAKVTSNTAAANSTADIVYNTTSGALFYNPNGQATGFGTGGLFLTLRDAPPLQSNNFVIET